MTGFLVCVALGVAGLGILTLTEATMGVGIIGLACLCGIFARIAQASYHQNQK